MNELTYCGTTQADLYVNGVQNGAGYVFKSPVGIAVHPRTHRVYVANTGNHRIKILDENLNFIGNFGGIGNKRPHDISFVDDGNNVTIYVADHGNNRIQVFTANDIVYSGPGGGARVQATGAGWSIFAIQCNRILKRTQVGVLVRRIPADGVSGDGNLQFNDPEGIAVHPVTGKVYVADTGNHRIKVLNENH